MATIATILDALADQLRGTLTLERDDLSVEPRAFAAQTIPAVDMFWYSGNGLTDIEGFGELQGAVPIIIRARASSADLYTGEDLLLALIDDEGPLSIVAAINDDVTLGGLTSDIIWGSWDGPRDVPVAGADSEFYVGAVLPCLLVKART